MNRAALVVLALTALAGLQAPSLSAQSPHDSPGLKSPVTARIVGIVPGAGHMYAGEIGHGLAYMGGTVGLVAISAGIAVGSCLGDALSDGTQHCNTTAADIALAGGIGLWAWSIYDAGRAAQRTNTRHAIHRTAVLMQPGTSVMARGALRRTLRLGLRLRR